MQVQKDEIRSKILAVAEKMFIRNGYDNTSLRMIADKCYISKSNIYRYYQSKEEIYETLVAPAREHILETINYFAENRYAYAGIYTEDKVVEISTLLSKVMVEYRTGLLIMLNGGGGRDRLVLLQKVEEQFVDGCPIEDQELKIQICVLLVTGIADILAKYSDEETIRGRLRLLLQYNYLGLNGVEKNGKLEV